MSLRSEPAPRRGVILAVVVALLLGAAVADGFRSDNPPDTVVANRAGVAPRTSALASTWFCPLATAAPGGQADGTVVIANPTRRPMKGTVTVVSSDGTRATKAIDVGALARLAVRQHDVLNAPYAAAIVELDGGGAVVEQSVSGPQGESTGACSARASSRWYLADGATTKAATLLVGIFNPFPENATVDLSFSTDQGPTAPAAYRPVTVPPGSLVVLNIGEHVRRRTNVSASIIARRGRVVVSKVQVHEGDGRKGLAVALAAPAAGTRWYFPEGIVLPGITERFHVYNPTQREARISIEFTLEEGAVEPFDRIIPPGGRLSIAPTDEDRVPASMGHSTLVRSLNDVAVIAERSIDGVSPARRTGFATTVGAPGPATRWVFAVGAADDGYDEWLVMNNVGRRAVTVSVLAMATGQTLAIEGLQDIEVGAGRRLAVRLGDHVRRSELAAIVAASGPIVVERALYRANGVGISLVPGTVLRD